MSVGVPGRSSTAQTPVAVAVVISGLLLVVAAWVWIPWGAAPSGLNSVSALDYFTVEELARAEAYTSSVRPPGLLSLAISIIILVVIARSTKVRGLIDTSSARRAGWVVVPVIVLSIHAVVWAATLPLGLWARAIRMDYGLTTQGLFPWIADRLIGEAIAVLVDLLLVGAFLAASRWARNWWPVVAGGCISILILLGSFVYPVAVEPVFNDFVSLQAGDLRDRILDLATQEGVGIDDVLVADASRRTTTFNAYVSGFGGTRRVVLYDTALEGLSEDELLVVVAHELSHARHNDVGKGTLLASLAVFLAVCILGLARPKFCSPEPDVPSGRAYRWIPVAMALAAVAGFLALPVQNIASRAVELRADVDAIAATGDPVSFASLQRELAVRSLADPTPPWLLTFWFASHPTTGERLGLVAAQPRP